MFDFLSDSSDDNSPESSSALSVIGRSSTMTGSLDLEEDDLRVDGTLDGDVRTKGRVHVARGGRVHGEIQARSIRIAGRAGGVLHARDSLVLLESAMVQGILCGESLTIEDGANFEGGICSVAERIPALKDIFSSTQMMSDNPSLQGDSAPKQSSPLPGPTEESVSSEPDPSSSPSNGDARAPETGDAIQAAESSSVPPETDSAIVETESQDESSTENAAELEW